MSSRGRTLTLFLIDDDPAGRIKCTVGIWNGIAYKIPKSLLEKCKDINYLNQGGIYFLFGTDNQDMPAVYVGQSVMRKNKGGLLQRIKEPHNSIDYWTEAVIFTTKDDTYGPTEMNYLENRFCNMAITADRYVVRNGNEPNPGRLTEEKESELEDFIDYVKLIIGPLGYKVFEPYIKKEDNIIVMHMTYGSGEANGCITGDGFVVFKGSRINPKITPKCPEVILASRKKYANYVNENNVLTKDLLFSSPSAAAKFVAGASVNGNLYWKDSFGISLKEIKQGI